MLYMADLIICTRHFFKIVEQFNGVVLLYGVYRFAMRLLSLLTIGIVGGACNQNDVSNSTSMSLQPNFHSLQARTLEGKIVDFSAFKGKKVLLVNTATACGLTPQLEGLQQLHKQYGDQLVVVGIPTNDFASQEPREGEEIGAFCQRNYGVDFLMLEKSTTKGSNKHPVFKWLTEKKLNGKKSSRIWWNFQKYLVDEKGELVDYFLPITQPDSPKILEQLK